MSYQEGIENESLEGHDPHDSYNRNLKLSKDVAKERVRQVEKWGEQNHSAEVWLAILSEEVGEFATECLNRRFSTKPNENFRQEVVQLTAVGLAILDWIDRGCPENKPSDKVLDNFKPPFIADCMECNEAQVGAHEKNV